MILDLLTILNSAFLNRCRGSRLYNLTTSTVVGRIVSALGMGINASFDHFRDLTQMLEIQAWSFVSLMLWSTFAWDKYWSAAIGNRPDMTKAAFAPVDWVMVKLRIPFASDFQLRLWGLCAITLRLSIYALCVVGLAFIEGRPEHAWYGVGSLLLGLPYYVWGYIKKDFAVEYAEYTVGALMRIIIISI
jgi:hypothetical protein